VKEARIYSNEPAPSPFVNDSEPLTSFSTRKSSFTHILSEITSSQCWITRRRLPVCFILGFSLMARERTKESEGELKESRSIKVPAHFLSFHSFSHASPQLNSTQLNSLNRNQKSHPMKTRGGIFNLFYSFPEEFSIPSRNLSVNSQCCSFRTEIL
jgi:hypothetical protein